MATKIVHRHMTVIAYQKVLANIFKGVIFYTFDVLRLLILPFDNGLCVLKFSRSMVFLLFYLLFLDKADNYIEKNRKWMQPPVQTQAGN